MSDDDDLPLVVSEPPAQPCDGVGVEVVGRLVREGPARSFCRQRHNGRADAPVA
ncbi:hypothetical protein ACF1G0_22780 [Streptomyces sp. NPDC013953]|uniref:hypothetical protein n=1 Tax=Streptomyces sp. NPDC013953 TaxID=3364868 RepID=UPI0036FCF818